MTGAIRVDHWSQARIVLRRSGAEIAIKRSAIVPTAEVFAKGFYYTRCQESNRVAERPNKIRPQFHQGKEGRRAFKNLDIQP